jgi:hypothetical protein
MFIINHLPTSCLSVAPRSQRPKKIIFPLESTVYTHFPDFSHPRFFDPRWYFAIRRTNYVPYTTMKITPPQHKANQANAQQSTGPKTPAGKEAVSQNAVTHGLTGKRLSLNEPEQAEFKKLAESMAGRFAPATPYEQTLTQQAAEYQWRLSRSFAVEHALTNKLVAEIIEENPGLSHDEAMAYLFADKQRSASLRLFMRYRGQHERGLRATIAQLEKAIAVRKEREAEVAWVQELAETQQKAAVIENGFVSKNSTAPLAEVATEPLKTLTAQNA